MKDEKINLPTLSEEDKETVRKILNEISKKGKSNQLEDLYLDDYEEIPVSLETFLSDEKYLGKFTNYGKDIYDTWKKELAYVHNPVNFVDQWAITRLFRWFCNYTYARWF